jgi:hypothetical protein
VRPPIDHFKRLFEEAYSNHKYPVRHKLKEYDMKLHDLRVPHLGHRA